MDALVADFAGMTARYLFRGSLSGSFQFSAFTETKRKVMFDAFLEVWYQLYCKEFARRPAKIFVDRQSTVCFVRRRKSGLGSDLFEPMAAGSRFTLTGFLDGLIRSDAALSALADAESLTLEETEALLLISQALVGVLEYSEGRAHVDRVLLTALSVWRTQAAGNSTARALMHRWFWLVFSDSHPLQMVRRHTGAVCRDGRLLPASKGRRHITPCQFASAVAKSPRTLNSVARHLGIDKYEAQLNIGIVSDFLKSLPHVDESAWRPIWTPGAIVNMWRSDKARFASTLKWALDGYVLVHRGDMEGAPVAGKSTSAMDALTATHAMAAPAEVKAHLEHFVDVTIMAVVRSLGDLESLLAHFREDAERAARFLHVLVRHLFRNERVLLSLAQARPLLARYPDGPWKPALLRFASARK